MKLYTIQTDLKWKEFQETGVLKAHDDIICFPEFLDSYNWIEGKMKNLLPEPEFKCKHPMWAWYKHYGKYKPDLRHTGYSNKGDILYRIEFDIEDEKVLLTDFEDWHLILNSDDLDKNTKHCNLELKWFDDNDIKDLSKKGWKILKDNFIYNWDNIILNPNCDNENVQATFWYITLKNVKKVTKFIAR